MFLKYSTNLTTVPIVANVTFPTPTSPKEAEQIGQNGKKSVLEKYNWQVEEKKMFEVYNGLIQ